MLMKRLLGSALLPLALLSGCTAPIDDAESDAEAVGEAEAALDAFDWSAPKALSKTTFRVFGVGTIGTKSVLVHNAPNSYAAQYAVRDGSGAYGPSLALAGLALDRPPAFAAYGGKLYMASTNGLDWNGYMIALRRFDPQTGTWSAQTRVAMSSSCAPALAASGGYLYLFGVDPVTRLAVFSRMDASGAWSPPNAVPSPSPRVHGVSATTFDSKVLLASYDDAAIKTQSYDGTSWSVQEQGPSWGIPTVASFAGTLHLFHGDAFGLWWSYKTPGAAFAVETTIGATRDAVMPVLTSTTTGVEVTYAAGASPAALYSMTYTPPGTTLWGEIDAPPFHK